MQWVKDLNNNITYLDRMFFSEYVYWWVFVLGVLVWELVSISYLCYVLVDDNVYVWSLCDFYQ